MTTNRCTTTVTVGLADADITGNDNRALQAAVDYIAGLGGGTVEIGAGTYTMRDSLHLRNRVTVRGQGPESVLHKADAVESPLTLDGDYGETGISIGHKDTDNTFIDNRAMGNGNEGVLLRDESEPMAGHRNYFERNEILNNGTGTDGCGIRILGETRDLTFVNNRIGNAPTGQQHIGILIGEKADRIELRDNDLSGNVDRKIEDRREGIQQQEPYQD